MRYKFRGKRFDNEKWVYGDLLHDRGYGGDVISDVVWIRNENNKSYQALHETVGQWTGIEDVYEGDIAKIFSYFYECGMQSRGYLESECKYEVVTFRDGAFYVGRTLLSNADYKIVGNIHDNPELMEVE